jgi:hypothetical protein
MTTPFNFNEALKAVQSGLKPVRAVLTTPRDRAGTFEP